MLFGLASIVCAFVCVCKQAASSNSGVWDPCIVGTGNRMNCQCRHQKLTFVKTENLCNTQTPYYGIL